METTLTVVILALVSGIVATALYVIHFCKKKAGYKFVAYTSILLSALALFCSIRNNPFEISDVGAIIGVIAGVIAIPTAIVIGWNIYSALDINKRMEKHMNDVKSEIANMQGVLENRIQSEISMAIEDYKHIVEAYVKILTTPRETMSKCPYLAIEMYISAIQEATKAKNIDVKPINLAIDKILYIQNLNIKHGVIFKGERSRYLNILSKVENVERIEKVKDFIKNVPEYKATFDDFVKP